MRPVIIGFFMVVTSLAIIMTLSTVLQGQAERSHPVAAGFEPRTDPRFDPRQAVTSVAKTQGSFFQRLAHRIFHGHDDPAPEPQK
jgi:hypothetical protein